jgi:hypothetical protein
LLGRAVFEQRAARSGAERLVDVLVEVEGGEDQNPRPLIDIGDDPAGGFEPVEVRHADIHEDDIGDVPPGGLDRPAAVTRFADHLDVRLGVEYHPEAGPHQLLVVCYDDADAHGRFASNGSRARTR